MLLVEVQNVGLMFAKRLEEKVVLLLNGSAKLKIKVMQFIKFSCVTAYSPGFLPFLFRPSPQIN
jgi:hypothetical protein